MNRTLSALVLASALVAGAGLVHAEPASRFEVLDRGDAVEVIGHGITIAGPTIKQVRERLELEVSGAPRAPRVEPADATVRVAELTGHHTMSVKLRLDRPEVKALAAIARVSQIGEDVHLIFPRRFDSPSGSEVPLPNPTIAPPASPAAAPAPPASPAAIASPPPPAEIAPPAPPIAATAAADTAAPGIGTTPAAPAAGGSTAVTAAPGSRPSSPTPGDKRTATPPRKDAGSTPDPLVIAAGLGCIGAGLWIMRRRRAAAGKAVASIEVVAQRALGGKARVVWLAAGDREMVVAVTPQNVRMLGQWRRPTEAGIVAEVPEAQALPRGGYARAATARPEFPPQWSAPAPRAATVPPPSASSPAVSGILRLRARTNAELAAAPPPPPPRRSYEDEEDAEADMVWAKEILEATGGRA